MTTGLRTYTFVLTGRYAGPDEDAKEETVTVKSKALSAADAIGDIIGGKCKVPRVTKNNKVVNRKLDAEGYTIKEAYLGNEHGNGIIRFPELSGKVL